MVLRTCATVWISPTFPCFPGLKSKFLFLRGISVSNFCTIISSPRLKKFLKLTFWNSLEWLNFCMLRSFLYLRSFFFNLSFRNTLEWCHFWGKKKNSEVKIWKKTDLVEKTDLKQTPICQKVCKTDPGLLKQTPPATLHCTNHTKSE